jgi:outer membrane protein assembly factor BamA
MRQHAVLNAYGILPLVSRILLAWIVFVCQIQSQITSFPLESVSIEGTALSKDAVLQLAGLRIGSSVDPPAFEAAARKLSDTGLFQSVNYRYESSSHNGFALTLSLTDPTVFLNATVDVPGINEDEFWRWLSSQYPLLNHKVPANEAAQLFLGRKIEEHLGTALDGHHIVGRLEADLRPGGKSTISFQPDPLPKIAALNFTGQNEFTAEGLARLFPKDIREQGYSDRSFHRAVELNLRRAYEERGMYRVRFPSILAERKSGWLVSVTTSVEEGPKFTLRDVQIVGDGLPVDAMLKVANFRKNEIANWTLIQNSIFELEKPVKRVGYLNAAAIPERILQDDQRILDLRLSFRLGPLYRFGQVQIKGLDPNLEAQARKIWNLNPGDPFDYDYPKDFFKAFFQSVDSRQFKNFKASMQKGSGENVMDFTVAFTQ